MKQITWNTWYLQILTCQYENATFRKWQGNLQKLEHVDLFKWPSKCNSWTKIIYTTIVMFFMQGTKQQSYKKNDHSIKNTITPESQEIYKVLEIPSLNKI